jgi:murein peptide amidase A
MRERVFVLVTVLIIVAGCGHHRSCPLAPPGPAEVGFETPAPPGSPVDYVKRVIGTSVEQRPIEAYMFNREGERPVAVMANVHGDEAEAHELSARLEKRWTSEADALGGAYVIFIACANPDGLERGTRENARRVDLNRNFSEGWEPGKKGDLTSSNGKPLSEPESKAIHDLIDDEEPAAIISIHACTKCGGMNNFDGPAEEFARRMSAENGYPASAEWTVKTPGSLGSWAGRKMKVPTVTLELPVGMGPEGYELNVRAVEAAIKMAAAQE